MSEIPDLQELVHVLAKRQIDVLHAEGDPIFSYVRVSTAESLLRIIREQKAEIERLRLQIRTNGHLSCEEELDLVKCEKDGLELRINQLESECGHLQADAQERSEKFERLEEARLTRQLMEAKQEIERLRAGRDEAKVTAPSVCVCLKWPWLWEER